MGWAAERTSGATRGTSNVAMSAIDRSRGRAMAAAAAASGGGGDIYLRCARCAV